MDTKSHYVILVVAYEPHWMKSKKHNELKCGSYNRNCTAKIAKQRLHSEKNAANTA